MKDYSIENAWKSDEILDMLCGCYGIRPGKEIHYAEDIGSDSRGRRCHKRIDATVVRAYPHIVQLQLDNGSMYSPSHVGLLMMLREYRKGMSK